MRKILGFLLLVLLLNNAFAQKDSVRRIEAVRTTLPIKIDGEINDQAWKTAPALDKLIEMRPTFGKPENERTKTDA